VRAAGPPEVTARLPGTPGVYRFRDARGRVLYLGRATDLRSRVRSYWGDLRDRRHLRAMVRAVVGVEAVPCETVAEATWLERNLLETSLPRWNRTRGGQESPVLIQLDAGPSAPGLRVLHVGTPAGAGPTFGPYLGGLKVRQAVAGLHRVLPLAYTGDRLPGSERDMARLRGLPGEAAGDHRAALVAELTSVLDGDPGAVARVLAGLAAARDRAATALAFELAARIQAEYESIEWITSRQRVTVAGGGDATVYGHAAGLLVRFDVVGGRLCRWRQRGCTAPRAARLLAATPPEWAGFAQRAADLAAQLAA